jgi:hypothetical protein
LSARADSVTISPQGEALTKLSQLHQADAARFKQLASALSERLRDQAEAGDEGAWIQRLADRFARAAETGDLNAVTLDRAVPESSEPHVVWRGGRGDGAELAWAGVLAQIGDAMASAQHAARSQAAHSAKVVVDAASVQRVAGIGPEARLK